MSAQKITLTTSDGVDIEVGTCRRAPRRLSNVQANSDVERQVAERSILIKNLLEDLGTESGEPIPIPNVRYRRSRTQRAPADTGQTGE